MIDARELRIGNYVWEDYSGYMRVVAINPQIDTDDKAERVYLAKYDRGLNGSYLLSEVKPIPLTPELLVKCGFRKSKLEGYDVHFKYFHPLLHTGIVALYDSEFSIKLDDVAREIKYLHQLQNLFFALTGQELQINLYE